MRVPSSLAAATPVIVRIIFGVMMFVHGLDKLTGGPAGFGQFLGSLGVPAPVFMAWVVTLLELVGGAMLVVGFLTRLVAAALAIELVFAIVLVTGGNGLIGAEGVGYERDLAYIGGFVALVLLGPGKPSIDHAVGLEKQTPALVDASTGSGSPQPV
jgi:putative oxidoreductase